MPSRPTFAQTLAASSSNAVLPMQCDEFLIQAQICKNTGGVRAHFLQKYEALYGSSVEVSDQRTDVDPELWNQYWQIQIL